MDESVREMWREYLVTLGSEHGAEEPEPTVCLFSDNPVEADDCARLVVLGKKRATASSVRELEIMGEAMPRVGDLQVVTDWAGVAQCVIRTNAVEVVPFGEVTAEFAAVEGEGDGSLEYWRRVHRAYYSRVLAGTANAVNDDLLIVCERFDVVFPVVPRI